LKDNWNAFVKKDLIIEPTGVGALDGLSFIANQHQDIHLLKRVHTLIRLLSEKIEGFEGI